MSGPLQSLDYIYMPSTDVLRDAAYFSDTLGGEIAFAIDEMSTRVVMLRLAEGPALLLADHLTGDAPVLVYRVGGLAPAMVELEARGWERGRLLELPMRAACSFTAPGGQRVAIYEPSRAFVVDSFIGRRDF